MPKLKKQISIILTDISDIKKVLAGLAYLFKKLILHYADDKDVHKLDIFIFSLAQYIGTIMKMMGYNENDFKDKK